VQLFLEDPFRFRNHFYDCFLLWNYVFIYSYSVMCLYGIIDGMHPVYPACKSG
jgi:hypothetical protein